MNDNSTLNVLKSRIMQALTDELSPMFNNDTKVFSEICVDMIQLYARKNNDYGNSFDKGMTDIGPAYGIGRLYDKMNRIVNLSKTGAKQLVLDESKMDTLQDLACYAIMTLAYYKKKPTNV